MILSKLADLSTGEGNANKTKGRAVGASGN